MAVLLKQPLRHARSLVVAPRMPTVEAHSGNPFTTAGDAVIDCDVPGCGWHAMGSRAELKKAWREHYRQTHGSDQVVGVVRINHPRHF